MANLAPYCAVYPDKEMTAQDFALLIEKMSVAKCRILQGCAITVSSNLLHVAAGWMLLYGRILRVTAGNVSLDSSTSGTNGTKYLLAEINIPNSTLPARIYISNKDAKGNDNVNVEEATSDGQGIAQWRLASFNWNGSTITNLKVAAVAQEETDIISQYTSGATSWNSGTVKPWGSTQSLNNLAVRLGKIGKSVTVSIVSAMQLPSGYRNRWYVIGEITIPEAYRPTSKVQGISQSVNNEYINDGKLTLWQIRSDGKLYINTNIESFTERICSFSYTI